MGRVSANNECELILISPIQQASFQNLSLESIGSLLLAMVVSPQRFKRL